jgi:hypothetical protein
MISNIGWRGVFIALVLALSFGNVGGIPLARATPDSAQNVSVSYSVFANPETFEIQNCPDAKQEIYVGVSRNVTKEISGKPYESSRSVNGVDVQVKTKPSNGSVSPSTASVNSMMRYTETFQTVFVYDPKKVGKDTITFSGQTSPDELLAPLIPGSIADATVTVKILPCNYKTRVIYRTRQPTSSINRTGSWIEYASMGEVLLEPNENGNFEAVGSYQLHGFETNVPECTLTWAGSDLPVDITGDLGQNVINLAFDFGFPEVTASFACTGDSFTTYPAILGQQNTAIPIAGGLTKIVGPVATNGTVAITVIVLPEAEQPAVSRTDRPVTWLSDWFEVALSLPGLSR